MLSLNEKLSEVQLLRLQATFHALPLFYLRTTYGALLVPHTCAYRYTCASIDIVSKMHTVFSSGATFFSFVVIFFSLARLFFLASLFFSFVIRLKIYWGLKHVPLSKKRAKRLLKTQTIERKQVF